MRQALPRMYNLRTVGGWLGVWLFALLFLVACNDATAMPSPVPVIAPTATATPRISVQASQPLTPTQASPPVSLAIPAINLTVAVVPMAWQVTQVEGERRAAWQVPEDKAGWHVNSAGAGALGNVIISGHHRQGQHVFAALARGEVVVGQQILLTDEQGRIFVYQVSEVSRPIPALGATQADQARAAAYLTADSKLTPSQAKLTLATGWPEFSDTHYIFVVADFSGMLAQGSTALHVTHKN